jgi:15-cis-phytoene synthase
MPYSNERMLGHNAAFAPAPFGSPLTLEACYRACGAITRRHSKSFALSLRFLPAAKRRAVWAVYAFCRTADDIADQAGAPAARLAAIDAWEAELRAAYAGRAVNPIFVAFADAAARYGVPLPAALDLLRGARMDVTVNRYGTYAQLRDYCYLVASTVGVLVTPILGALDEEALGDAVALGHAMQLTNILRDVGEDARMGRVYLPADEMASFGYTEADLFAATVDARFVALMRFQIERARHAYRAAEPGIARLQPESRYTVRLALYLYRGILGAIEANGYDVFTKRAYVPLQTKILTALSLGLQR